MAGLQWVGVGTHIVILVIGLLGLVGKIPLPRAARTGGGLVLMAFAMFVLSFGWGPAGRAVAAVVHPLAFGIALWLLIGPIRRVRVTA